MEGSTPPAERHAWLRDDREVLGLLRQAVGAGAHEPAVPGHRLLREIASGAQGAVFEAVRESDGRRVAVKVLARLTYPTSRAARRLERELDLVRRLDHPGIVPLLDSGFTAAGQPFLVMELLPGGTLGDAIPIGARDGVFPDLPAALRAFLEICAAVEHAHKRGVLHRDLKPGNILLDGGGHPKVADFGIAKDLVEKDGGAPEGGPPMLTRTGDLLGSLAYAAPEQLSLIPGDVDVRSDVYSLGVILYEMLTGATPVGTEGSLLEVLRHLEVSRPGPPSRALRARRASGALPPGVPFRLPHDLDAVVLNALARDKEDRYQSVAELAADVRRVLDNRPVHANRERLMVGLVRFAGRHRLVTASAAVAMAALALTALQSLRISRERERLYAWALDSQSLLLDDALGAIGRLTGGQPFREQLVRKTLASFERILEDYPGDAALRGGRARALVLLGQQRLEQGDPGGAMALYQEALGEYRSLCAVSSPSAACRHGLSLALVKIGDLHKGNGDENRAGALYEEALALDKALVAEEPANPPFLDTLFWSCQRLGDLARRTGNLALARERFERLAPLAARLEALAPELPGTRLARLAVPKAWAAYEIALGRPGRARVHLEEALRAAREGAAAAPESLDDQAQLAWALYHLSGNEFADKALVDAAWAHGREAVRLAESLVAAEPQNLDLRLLETTLRLSFLEIEAGRTNGLDSLEPALQSLVNLRNQARDRPDILAGCVAATELATHTLFQEGHPLAAARLALVPLEAEANQPAIPEVWRAKILVLAGQARDCLAESVPRMDGSAALSEAAARFFKVMQRLDPGDALQWRASLPGQ